MSDCICNDQSCDEALSIVPDLDNLTRQIGTFADFRAAMLAQIRHYPALERWQSCGQQDFGLMLLEMWAYVLDVQSFYDAILANESYLHTAKNRQSLRKLIELLGYVPRPAVAATTNIALLAGGSKAVTLPAGTAFRSGAFDDQSPQVFELETGKAIHPLNNKWNILLPASTTLSASSSSSEQTYNSLLVSKDTKLITDDLVLVRVIGQGNTYKQVRKLTDVSDHETHDGQSLKKISFDENITLKGDFLLTDIRIERRVISGGLWTKDWVSGDPKAIANSRIVLDSLYRNIKSGQYVILEMESKYRWFKVETVTDVDMTLSPATTETVKDSENNNVDVPIPSVKAPATRIKMTQSVETGDWNYNNSNKMTLHYGLESAADVVLEAPEQTSSSDGLNIDTGKRGSLENPNLSTSSQNFLLQDKNLQGVSISGELDYDQGKITLDIGSEFTDLDVPLTTYGNIIEISRGESVSDEIMGSGDATLANQFFVLKKSPLTYLNLSTSNNEQGVINTLTVYVNGIAWQEASSFYGIGPDEEVYVLRQGDDEETYVHFGDGRYGARLPSGTNNVIAYYRHGAGAAAPPADSISQMVKPVKDINEVVQVLDAEGGADAEPADDIRNLAPRSALLLGRAISIEDMEVVAASVPGVDAASAEWRWQKKQQRPVVQVWYIGDASENLVLEKLQLLSAKTTAIDVEQVNKFPLGLSLDVDLDEKYIASDVISAIREKLLGDDTGTLLPENIGFERAVFRSQVFADVLSVSGVIAVNSAVFKLLWWFDIPWNTPSLSNISGYVWDFVTGGISINGQED